MKGFMNVTQVSVATDVKSVIIALVVSLRDTETFLPPCFHLFVDIRQVPIFRRSHYPLPNLESWWLISSLVTLKGLTLLC